MENMTTEELRERAALIKQMRTDLEAIAELSEPDEDEIRALGAYRADLEAIQKLDGPDEDEIRTVAQHRANLEAIEGAA